MYTWHVMYACSARTTVTIWVTNYCKDVSTPESTNTWFDVTAATVKRSRTAVIIRVTNYCKDVSTPESTNTWFDVTAATVKRSRTAVIIRVTNYYPEPHAIWSARQQTTSDLMRTIHMCGADIITVVRDSYMIWRAWYICVVLTSLQ